ncbi:MAG: type II secretion system F family protein [Candidatus Bathyarchaeia archaeon]
MKVHEALEKIKQFFIRLKTLLKGPLDRKSAVKSENVQKTELYSVAYKFIGEKTGRILPLFRDLDLNLQKSGLKVSFKAYVSLTVFTALLLSLTAMTIIPSMLFFSFKLPILPALMFGIGGSLFACAFVIIGFYIYPLYRADKVKRDLEDELPFTTGYMAILSSAGVSPEKIFYSLSNLSPPLAISNEAKNIVRNINLFGSDIISALEETSKLTPSKRFREMLEGFISTIHSGGNLASYLREKSTQYMKLKRITLRKFSDTLSILSEFYVAVLVTGPLLFVIMLAVMGMLGGSLGALGPDILLDILTYVGIPLGSITFLIILDAVSPKW